MEPEAAQDSDAPVARCPDAPIESRYKYREGITIENEMQAMKTLT